MTGPEVASAVVAAVHAGDLVTRSPGIDAIRARKTGDFNFHVLTVRGGKIVALRACRDRDEALGFVAAAAPGSK